MKRTALIAFSLISSAQVAQASDISSARESELLNLLKHDCGSCHGLSLKGGLGPALTPDVLRQKPIEYITATILYGRSGTPMPPWRPFLSEGEANWLAQRIKEGVH
ncbi:MAG: cytochrome c [Candidatus Thiodiazotropha weberae]|nr:cytochrome c [Candidatus Thiodiazotropha lotti]MCG8014212.1 cytochrome c [Candidatus Thiodiazotropha lotti]MCG8020359.1 cytochrome c [Candidatus Thiodiazotropha lotti]MCW4207522.1 cytochrome c [Candidatus Thiodiazotropha lotti]MCW4213694.1 cytochrome c [Candidatus Thiodiazotropha lotti]